MGLLQRLRRKRRAEAYESLSDAEDERWTGEPGVYCNPEVYIDARCRDPCNHTVTFADGGTEVMSKREIEALCKDKRVALPAHFTQH